MSNRVLLKFPLCCRRLQVLLHFRLECWHYSQSSVNRNFPFLQKKNAAQLTSHRINEAFSERGSRDVGKRKDQQPWDSYSITVIADVQSSRQHRHYSWGMVGSCGYIQAFVCWCPLSTLTLFLPCPSVTHRCICKRVMEAWTWWFQIKKHFQTKSVSQLYLVCRGISVRNLSGLRGCLFL